MKTMNPRPPIQRGLTLIELVVAMAIAGIVMTAAYAVFLLQQKSYAVQDQVVEIQQNARVAMNLLARDMRMAGHGVPSSPIIIKGTPYTDALVIDGDGGGVTLLGCFGAPEGYLSKSAATGATEIELVDSKQAEKFDVGDRGYVFIGGYDKAVIKEEPVGKTLVLKEGTKKRYPTTYLKAKAGPGDTSISVDEGTGIQVGDILTLGNERLYVTGIAGKTIDFDTDPTTPPADPIQSEYGKETLVNPIPVYRVQALHYDLQTGGRLTREDRAVEDKVAVVEKIQDLTVTQAGSGTCEITLTARADVPDEAGRFRSQTFSFAVRCRNL